MPAILRGKAIKGLLSQELISDARSVHFLVKKGVKAKGVRAELLPKICDVFLSAREAGELDPQQEHIAQHCEVIIRGLAQVGIIALVDDATGYQYSRGKEELKKYLLTISIQNCRHGPSASQIIFTATCYGCGNGHIHQGLKSMVPQGASLYRQTYPEVKLRKIFPWRDSRIRKKKSLQRQRIKKVQSPPTPYARKWQFTA